MHFFFLNLGKTIYTTILVFRYNKIMKRKDKLLMLLENQSDWITGKQLAQMLNVTDRTIRYDIEAINRQHKVIESDLRKGYRLLDNKNHLLKNQQDINIPITPKERCDYILQKLLIKKQKISIHQLLDEIYISEYSLDNDLKRLKEMLSNYPNLKISKHDNYLVLQGDEKSKRLLYKNLLTQEASNNFFNMNEIASLYKKFDLLKAKQIMEGLFHQYEYDIDEIHFPTLMIHIGVAIERMLDFNYLPSNIENEDIKKTVEYQISTDFFQQISNVFQLPIVESEIMLLSCLLMSKKSYNYNCKWLFLNNNHQYEMIIHELIDYIYSQYGINFSSNKSLVVGLSLHLQALVQRNKDKIHSPNFYLNEIKKRFPLIFELAVSASDFLSKLLNITIQEAEIGFIALHLGLAYEQMFPKKYKAVLIFPKTQAISKIPIAKITNIFEDSLEIIQQFTYFEEDKIHELKPDLIITTTPLKHRLDILTIQISFFMTHEDEAKIRSSISLLTQKKLKKEYEIYLDRIITKEHFYTNKEFETVEATLKFLADDLYQSKNVEEAFYESLMKRESFSPTSFAYGFAIPHALDSSLVYQSNISIMILNKPLKWGDYEVSIIFLLAVDRYDNHILTLFFEWITSLYTDIPSLTKVLHCKSYEEFMKLIK